MSQLHARPREQCPAHAERPAAADVRVSPIRFKIDLFLDSTLGGVSSRERVLL